MQKHQVSTWKRPLYNLSCIVLSTTTGTKVAVLPHPWICFHNVGDAVSTDIDLSCREIFCQTKQLYPSPHFGASGREGHTWRLQLCRIFSSTCLLTMWTHIIINWAKSHELFYLIVWKKPILLFTSHFPRLLLCNKRNNHKDLNHRSHWIKASAGLNWANTDVIFLVKADMANWKERLSWLMLLLHVCSFYELLQQTTKMMRECSQPIGADLMMLLTAARVCMTTSSVALWATTSLVTGSWIIIIINC